MKGDDPVVFEASAPVQAEYLYLRSPNGLGHSRFGASTPGDPADRPKALTPPPSKRVLDLDGVQLQGCADVAREHIWSLFANKNQNAKVVAYENFESK